MANSMQRLNTIHITVLETRGFPKIAGYLTVHCGKQKVKLANVEKGALVRASGGSLIGAEAAEAIWFNFFDKGIAFDSNLGSCMLMLSMFDLHQRPYEGWLPLVTLEGKLVGRFAVQIFGDWSERLKVGILKATIAERPDAVLSGEPFVELRCRDCTARTGRAPRSATPVWEQHFTFFVGSRDRLKLTLLDQDPVVDTAEKFGAGEVLGMDMIKRKGETMWVPIVNKDQIETGQVLISLEGDQWQQWLPLRILQAKGLANADIGSLSDMFVEGRCGEQTFTTTVKPNTSDPVWDEEFQLEGRQRDALHLLVKDKDLFFDDPMGEAFIPMSELSAHLGEQVWVDLTGTDGRHNGKLLLWIQPPPGSVYPDTLARKRLVAYDHWDAIVDQQLGGPPTRPRITDGSGGQLGYRSAPGRVPAITYAAPTTQTPVPFTPAPRAVPAGKTRGGYDAALDYRNRS